ncbi:MAG: hypothetical protein QOD63_2040 [Actinomycetota bacterium]|jgi:Uma2 family endonuclease|nr:hypothetical protein [Actinomycetota bacterium]
MLIQRRQALGLDTFDEVWDGAYHMAPATHPAHGYVDHALAVVLDRYAKAADLVATGPFNLGQPDDYRVPDHGYHRGLPQGVWVPTAAVVVEVVSPDDESYAKFGFYAAHGVDELIVADPHERSVRCFRRTGSGTPRWRGAKLSPWRPPSSPAVSTGRQFGRTASLPA